MIIHTETKIGRTSIFAKKVIDEDGNVVSERKVNISVFYEKYDDKEYVVIYSSKMRVITDAYRYLNVALGLAPPNSRKSVARALKLLYAFMELTGYDLGSLNAKSYVELIAFLRGVTALPENYSLITYRCNDTVNSYLATFRLYFQYLELPCEVLFETEKSSKKKVITQEANLKPKYKGNLKVYKDNEVPKYISPNEFKELYNLALKNNDRTAMILFHLMYAYGLRLGEALGLTLEDVTEVKENNKYVPVIIIRNRMSDKYFQYAKRLLHVTNPKQYHGRDYRSSSNKIVITNDFYAEICKYINEVHYNIAEKYPLNYEKTIADTVTRNNDLEDDNHYLFLNRYARILTAQGWNKHLKKYFLKAGIPIDQDKRKDNLSHRFRHGFAMFHVHFSEHPVKDLLTLSKLMRHNSILSCASYFNPTKEDQRQLKEAFQKELQELIPEIKK